MEKKKRKKAIIWSIIGVVVIGIIIAIVMPKKKVVTWNTQEVKTGSVELAITATGYVQPVEKVEIGTQVSGKIEAIYVDFNSHVKKGQLLAELDKSTLNERLSQTLASERSAQASLTLAQQNYDRIKELYENNAATKADFEQSTSQLTQAKSQYENAKASVRQARVDLGYAEIYSTVDGVVLDRKVEIGQTVASSFSTPTMFVIAKDLTNMQIEANIDEADIGQVKVGQHVDFSVDAYPKETFIGTVKQVRLQPTVTNNVVTYTVVINTANPDEKLYPGMTASVTIITQNDTALTVPLEAMNYEPTTELLKKLNIPMEELGIRGKHVWIKDGETMHPVAIETGINDGVNTIVKSGLKGGETVVVSALYEEINKKPKEEGARLFGPPNRKK
ncbi:MAG: efflux RND transporter periplasmic adaptor subunit [Paludibacteraceae bacterium]|nr:efflux RND transporter periplasmic adaptor subunit [Paludibacteraceae bacterium]